MLNFSPGKCRPQLLNIKLLTILHAKGFVSEWDDGSEGGVRANVSLVAGQSGPFLFSDLATHNSSLFSDHADYIGRLAGREHLGIGSDFDGIANVPEGLEVRRNSPLPDFSSLITIGRSRMRASTRP